MKKINQVNLSIFSNLIGLSLSLYYLFDVYCNANFQCRVTDNLMIISIQHLILCTVIFLTINTFIFYNRIKNPGWKRLFLISSIIITAIICSILLLEYRGPPVLVVLSYAFPIFVICLLILTTTLNIHYWIKKGFLLSKENYCPICEDIVVYNVSSEENKCCPKCGKTKLVASNELKTIKKEKTKAILNILLVFLGSVLFLMGVIFIPDKVVAITTLTLVIGLPFFVISIKRSIFK